jgi:phage-related minor tail protein
MTNIDLNGFQTELAGASAALQEFAQVQARRAADDVGAAFDRAGDRIAAAMGRAARGGEVSFKRLAQVVLEEFARLALDRIFTQQSGSQTPFFGARAAGGGVNAGGAYLVGERGPEWFVPGQHGAIAAQGAGAVAIHFHLGASADAAAIARHQGQIAAAVARAVAYGRRNL